MSAHLCSMSAHLLNERSLLLIERSPLLNERSPLLIERSPGVTLNPSVVYKDGGWTAFPQGSNNLFVYSSL